MKNFIYLGLILILTSCGAYKNEVWFYADGSGKSKVHIDMGEMMKQMKSAFSSMASDSSALANSLDFSDSLNIDTAAIFDPAWYENIGDSSYVEEEYMDTTMYSEEYVETAEPYYGEDSTYAEYADPLNMVDTSFVYEAPAPDPIKDRLAQVFDGLKNKSNKIDTSFTFYDILSVIDSPKIENLELLKNVSMTIYADSAKEEMWFDMVYLYKNENEIKEMLKSFRQLSEKTGGAASNPGLNEYNFHHNPKAKTIISDAVNLYDGVNLKEEDKAMFETMSDEELAPILQMMGMGMLETTIYLPGKFKSATGIEYTLINDNTILIKQSLVTYLKSGTIPGYEIKYE